MRCNQQVKFGVLLARARAIGATHVATGHYARIGRRAQTWTLHRACEAGKDQSYTLHRLDQAQLGAALLPLGDVARKSEVRAEAAALGLVTAAKPDSQELCFVGDDLAADLGRRLAGRFRPGPIVDRAGRVLGEHRGLPFYTVGQRSRLGIRPDRPDAIPLYVLELDAAANRVVVGAVAELRRSRLTAGDCRWVSGAPPEDGTEVQAQLRAHGRAHPAEVVAAEGRSVQLRFPEPAGQAAPGQAVVLYRGDEVIGGGVVEVAA